MPQLFEPIGDAPQPTSEGLYKKMAGFATFGLAVRALQLAILKKPYMTAPQHYAYNFFGWGGVGYWWYYQEIKQKGLLAQAEKEIGERRQKKRQLIEPPVPLESALPPLERM